MIIDDIKSRITIVEIAEREGLRLKKHSNRIYKSLCCFHHETKPSLTFYTDTNRFYCFACTDKEGRSGGDVIHFYARMHDLSNSEAIKQLGKGIMLKQHKKGLESPKRAKPQKAKSELNPDRFKIYEALREFCGELDPESRAYLTSQSRGLTNDTIKQFSIF